MIIPSDKSPDYRADLETLKVDGWKVRAAQKFQAVKDVRYYLEGFVLKQDGRICATNGHCMFVCPIERPPVRDIIIKIIGKVPASAVTVEFEFTSEVGGIARCVNGRLETKDVHLFEVIDGKFPDIDRVIPSTEARARSKEVEPPMPAFNIEYIVKCRDAIKAPRHYPTVIFEPQLGELGKGDSRNEPLVVQPTSIPFSECMFIIMPCRV